MASFTLHDSLKRYQKVHYTIFDLVHIIKILQFNSIQLKCAQRDHFTNSKEKNIQEKEKGKQTSIEKKKEDEGLKGTQKEEKWEAKVRHKIKEFKGKSLEPILDEDHAKQKYEKNGFPDG